MANVSEYIFAVKFGVSHEQSLGVNFGVLVWSKIRTSYVCKI